MKLLAIGFIVCLLISAKSVAQKPSQLAVDTISNIINETLPFDRPFVLRVKGGSSTSIISAFLLEWRIKNNNRSLVLNKRGTVKNKFIPRENVFKQKDGVDVYIPALLPNKTLALLFAHQFDGELLKDIYKSNFLLHSGSQSAAESILKNIPLKVKNQVRPVYGLSGIELRQLKEITTFNSDGIDSKFHSDYIDFFNKNLKTKYDSITSTVHSHTYSNLIESNLKIVLNEADIKKIPSSELNSLVVLIKKNQLRDLLIGTASVDTENASAEHFDIKKRVDNLTTSIKSIEKVRTAILLLGVRTSDGVFTSVENDLSVLVSDLTFNRDLIKEKYNLIKSVLENNSNLNYSDWALGNNELTDIKTKGTYQIIPEIGLVTIVGIGNEQNETIIRPYLGASIYLRPIDKSVPYKYLTNQLLHRLSFNLGVTLGKIDKGEFSDLSSSFTLLTGVNIKIIREMSFSVGTAIMQRQNSNPAIDAKQTSFNPYAGISFDFDIANGIQKLTGKLFP